MARRRWSNRLIVVVAAVVALTLSWVGGGLSVAQESVSHVQSQRVDAARNPGATVTVSPARIADSRSHQQIPGAVPALGSFTVQVTGNGGVPSTGVAAAILTVTVVTPGAAGYATVWPAGLARPATSGINFQAGQTIANTAIVRVGTNGALQLFNGSMAPAHMIVDVTGYIASGAANLPGSTVTVTPSRIADSRVGQQVAGAVPALTVSKVQVTGRGGIPASGISAVLLNVTAVAPQAVGHATLWATGAPKPETSNMNFIAGQNIANSMMVPVGPDGAVQLFNGSTGATHFAIDVTGYILAGAPDTLGATVPVRPNRMVDSRINQQTIGPVAPFSAISIVAAGPPGGWSGTLTYQVPAAGVNAVVLNVTAVAPQSSGYLTVWSDASPQPETSTINFQVNQTIATMAVVPVSEFSQVKIYNASGTRTDVLVDVVGYAMIDAPTSGTVVGLVDGPWQQFPEGDGRRFVPQQIAGMSSVASVGMTDRFRPTTYFVGTNGAVQSWGYGRNGELGNGTAVSSAVPVNVSGLTGAVAVAGGGEMAIALKGDGTVWAWGSSDVGQLGSGLQGDGARSLVPVQVSGLTQVKSIAATGSNGFALRSDGTVWTWGSQFLLGSETTADAAIPQQIPNLTNVVGIAARWTTAYAVRSDGTVWAWGSGAAGQLGTASLLSATPVQVSGITGATAVAASVQTAYALLADGTVRAWGTGESGALGIGPWKKPGTDEAISTAVPVEVSGLRNVTNLATSFQNCVCHPPGRDPVGLGVWRRGRPGSLMGRVRQPAPAGPLGSARCVGGRWLGSRHRHQVGRQGR